LRDNLSKYDKMITEIEPDIGPFRVGDVSHSQASIIKAKQILGYEPLFNSEQGFKLTAEWYYMNEKG
jgi:UDP-N-acetylglucosamine 4-epimerase